MDKRTKQRLMAQWFDRIAYECSELVEPLYESYLQNYPLPDPGSPIDKTYNDSLDTEVNSWYRVHKRFGEYLKEQGCVVMQTNRGNYYWGMREANVAPHMLKVVEQYYEQEWEFKDYGRI